MLICFWSPKGGCGTSVVTAAAAALCARAAPARVADLTGDQPAVLAIGADPDVGLRDWLRAGPETPSDALDQLTIDVGHALSLLPAGAPGLHGVLPEAGAALAVALSEETRVTVCDAGRLDHPALAALAEVADMNIVVVRGCYLALRAAIHHPAIEHASSAIVITEHGRALGARDVEDVLDLPVLTTIEARTQTAHAVDAGVLVSRMPDALSKPLRHALLRAGCFERRRAA